MTEPSNLGQHQASSSDHLYSASAHAWNPSGILPGELHTSPHESLSNPRDVSATVETNEVLPQSQWAVLNMENYALQQTLLMRRTKEEENCDGSALHLLLRTLSQGGFQLPMGDRSYGGQEEAVLGDHMMRGVRGSYSLVLPSETISGPALPLRSPSASGGPLTRAETSPGFGWPTIGEGPDGRDKVYEKHVVGAIEKDVEFGEINILLINWETCSVASVVNDGREAKRGSSDVDGNRANACLALKKPRVEGRSSISAFKVRKEKLGDRIAALQQLVAPFGKTDTASVLMEAIGYIKFLQDQVETLSVPYLRSSKNKKIAQGSSGQESGEPKLDLRSKGLCLVPLSCTSYITNENIGIWPPNLSGGTFNN